MDVKWHSRNIVGGLILNGTVVLPCRHKVTATLEVSDMDSGKRKVRDLLHVAVAAHTEGCSG